MGSIVFPKSSCEGLLMHFHISLSLSLSSISVVYVGWTALLNVGSKEGKPKCQRQLHCPLASYIWVEDQFHNPFYVLLCPFFQPTRPWLHQSRQQNCSKHLTHLSQQLSGEGHIFVCEVPFINSSEVRRVQPLENKLQHFSSLTHPFTSVRVTTHSCVPDFCTISSSFCCGNPHRSVPLCVSHTDWSAVYHQYWYLIRLVL